MNSKNKFSKSFLPIRKRKNSSNNLINIKSITNKQNNIIEKNKRFFNIKLSASNLNNKMKDLYKFSLCFLLKNKIKKINWSMKDDKAIDFKINIDRKTKILESVKKFKIINKKLIKKDIILKNKNDKNKKILNKINLNQKKKKKKIKNYNLKI